MTSEGEEEERICVSKTGENIDDTTLERQSSPSPPPHVGSPVLVVQQPLRSSSTSSCSSSDKEEVSASARGSLHDGFVDDRPEIEVTNTKVVTTTATAAAAVVPVVAVAAPVVVTSGSTSTATAIAIPVLPKLVCYYRIPALQRSFMYTYTWMLKLADFAAGKTALKLCPNDVVVAKICSNIGNGTRSAFIPIQVEVRSAYNSSPWAFIVSGGKWLRSPLPRIVTGSGKSGNFEILPGKTVNDVSTGGLVIYARSEKEIKCIEEFIETGMPTGFAGIKKCDIEKGVIHREVSHDVVIPKGSYMAAVIAALSAHEDLKLIDAGQGNYIMTEYSYGVLRDKLCPLVKKMRNYISSIKKMSAKLRFVTNASIQKPDEFVKELITNLGVKEGDDDMATLMNVTYTIQATVLVSGWFFQDKE